MPILAAPARVLSRLSASSQDRSFLTRLFRWLLYCTIAVTPIFFLPGTTEPFEWNKTALFVVLVALAAAIAFLRSILTGRAFAAWTPLNWFILGLVVVAALATVFSVNRYASIVGLPGYHQETFTGYVAFALFFFLVVHAFRTAADVRCALRALLIGLSVFVAVELLQLLKLYVFPWDMAKNQSFNLLGNSFTALGLVSALTGILSFGSFDSATSKAERIWLGTLTIAALAVLVLLDATVGWYALILGILGFLIALNRDPGAAPKRWIAVLVAGAAFAVLCLFLPLNRLTGIRLNADLVLDTGTSAAIVRDTLAHQPALGTGPATFNVDFASYRPVRFNESPLADYRFIKASNAVFQYLATLGILGALALLAMIVRFLWLLLKSFRTTSTSSGSWQLLVTLTAAWGILLFGGLVFPKTFVLSFFFWFLLALLTRLAVGDDDRKRLTAASRAWAPVGLVLALVLLGSVAYFGGRLWLAECAYGRASADVRQTKDIVATQGVFERAVRLNPWDPRLRFSLAQHLLVRAQLDALGDKPDVAAVRQLLGSAESEAAKGVALAPQLPESYESLASVYESLGRFLGVAATAARQAQALRDAQARDPHNAAIALQRGQMLLRFAQSVNEAEKEVDKEDAKKQLADQKAVFLTEAKEVFTKAMELKRESVDARLGLALLDELAGNGTAALAALEKLARDFPADATLRAELGFMNVRQDATAAAEEDLRAALDLDPTLTNARYQLAKLYEKKGELDQAIAELEQVAKDAPDNVQIKDELEALRKKKGEQK